MQPSEEQDNKQAESEDRSLCVVSGITVCGQWSLLSLLLLICLQSVLAAQNWSVDTVVVSELFYQLTKMCMWTVCYW